PDYLPLAAPLDLQDLAGLARAARAVLVEFRVTAEGTFAFLLGPGEDDVGPEQVLSIPDLDNAALLDMLGRFEGEAPAGGWLVQYDLFRRGRLALPDWLAAVDRTTQELHDRLLAPVWDRLRDRYPGADRLVLVPNQG